MPSSSMSKFAKTAVFPRIFVILGLSFIPLIGLIITLRTPTAQAMTINCSDSSWAVGTEANLNDAISCFNSKTSAGTYTISFTQNISLTTSSTDISNTHLSTGLLVEGNDFAIDGQDISGVRPFEVEADTAVAFQNITIMNGNVTDMGGGILNLQGTITITNSTLKSNSATSHGGGIENRGGTITIVNSTIMDNQAADGGGIFNDGIGSISIINSTLSHNSAVAGGGGAIFNIGSGAFSISHSTISHNSATFNGGGIFNLARQIDLDNSIIANSVSGGDCSDISDINSNGTNLDGDGSCGLSNSGDISNQDPLLGPLQDNGGDTWTHSLLEDSPAIDAGNSLLIEDQRDESRPQGSSPDIGAVEVEATEFKIFMPLIYSP